MSPGPLLTGTSTALPEHADGPRGEDHAWSLTKYLQTEHDQGCDLRHLLSDALEKWQADIVSTPKIGPRLIGHVASQQLHSYA